MIFHVFRSETVKRERVFSRLKEFMGAGNPHLRTGALDCLIAVCEDLTADQKQQAVDLLKIRLGSQAERSGKEDESVMLAVTRFFGDCPSNDSLELLFGVIRNCPYKDPRNQAVLNLCKVVIGLPVEKRDSVIADLERMVKSGTVPGYLILDIENTVKKIKSVSCL